MLGGLAAMSGNAEKMRYSIHYMKIRISLILIALCLHLFFAGYGFGEKNELQTDEVVVLYEESLAKVAHEVAKAYPSVKSQLVATLNWKIDSSPEIVLVKGRNNFREMAGNDIIVAFAEPERNLIVLDTSRVYNKPFTLEATLKHELCHLILHRHIERGNLPRWIDEGVCQWASGGIAELMAGDEGRVLAKAEVSGRLISMSELETFPEDERSLILAYEESKSIVEYIVSEYGKQGILNLLENLKEGYSLNDSILKSLSITPSVLESGWQSNLKRKYTWFSYLSDNLYTILFVFAALVTVYGFIRLLKKKREYKDEDEEEDKSLQ